MTAVLCVAAGGALGSALRYLLAKWIGQPDGLPIGIFAVNVVGALLLGLLATLLLDRFEVSPNLRLALTVGLLGGFTTFSTLSVDSLNLLNDGRWPWALANLVVSAVAGLAAAWLGQQLARL